MCDESILNDWSPESLRRWAFDESLVLLEQDEDLVVGRPENLQTLLPFADDPSCPKADYILSSFDFSMMFIILRGSESDQRSVHTAIELAEGAIRKELIDWANLLKLRLLYRDGVGRVDRPTALKMGDDLLNGICRRSEISISSETADAWEVQLSVPPFHRHREWLTINKLSGNFIFRQ